MTSLSGKVAIVTGSGRGLGYAMATSLAEAGASVVVTGRTEAELDSFVEEQARLDREALACPTDITSELAVERMVARTIECFGRVDILVNNAGIVSTKPLLDLATDEWERVLDTNLRGVFLSTRAVGRHLVEQGSGKVVNVASNFGLMGVPLHAAYSASKAAVIAFTRSMALEWARFGVQVNALAPGYFATPLNEDVRADEDLHCRIVRAIPARRMGVPEELGPWLLLMVSDASDFMTGECIVIDGGQAAR